MIAHLDRPVISVSARAMISNNGITTRRRRRRRWGAGRIGSDRRFARDATSPGGVTRTFILARAVLALVLVLIVIFMIGFATGAIVAHRALPAGVIVAHRVLLAGATSALGKGAVRGGEYPESRRQRQNQAEDLREASHKTPFDRRQAPQTCDWVTNSPPRERGDKLPAVPPQDRGYLNFITLLAHS